MNLLLWTTHVAEEHFPLFGKLKAAGFDGVEIPLFGGDAAHYRTVRKELDNHGLACTSVTVANPEANPISPDAGLRQKGLDHINRTVARFLETPGYVDVTVDDDEAVRELVGPRGEVGLLGRDDLGLGERGRRCAADRDRVRWSGERADA